MADFSLYSWARALWTPDFPGRLAVWSLKTKKAEFYSHNELEALTADVGSRMGEEDLYIGLSTQPEGLPPTSRGSNDTAVMLPGFFLDVDFASSKQSAKRYPPDLETALGLIESFETKPFFIQHSGNGLHVLYRGLEPLVMKTREERRRAASLSKKFASRTAAHFRQAGYEIDSVGDLARVFRVPGTLNHKSHPPKPVRVIQYDPDARFSWSDIEDMTVEAGEPHRQTVAIRDRRLADHNRIRSECGWYSDLTGKGAATSDEPNWYAVASITARCSDGEQIFHDYSSRHPQYDPVEAGLKFARAREEAGPRTCTAISDDLGNSAICARCPHRGEITSPVQLGFSYDPGMMGPKPLGFAKDGSFVFLDQVRKIIVLANSQQLLSHMFLLGLAPTEFWRARFPVGERSRSLFDARLAGEALMAACKMAGPFRPENVRGRGVWREGDVVIVNLGGKIETPVKHLYLCFEPLEVEDVPAFDGLRLFELLKLLPWRNPLEAVLVLGWMALAPICGVLAWRPHLFIYGPPNSGKTTLHRLSSSVLQPLVVSADGQSTEAGLRQMLGPDSLPVAIDEFETDHHDTRLRSIIRLARSASSADSPVLRGTPEGKAMMFSLRAMFYFTAINVTGMSPADETRIIIVELVRHENDALIGRKIEEEMIHFGSLGPRWSGYMVSKARFVEAAINAFALALPGINSRHRQNMATLLAGAFLALEGRPPNEQETRAWVEVYRPILQTHGRAHDRDDAQEALNHLLQFPIRSSGGFDVTLGQWIAQEKNTQAARRKSDHVEECTRTVGNFDIRVMTDGRYSGWMIRNGAPSIDKVFAGTRWANGAWRKALGQIPGAFSPDDPVQFPTLGKKQRGIILPFEFLPEPMRNGPQFKG